MEPAGHAPDEVEVPVASSGQVEVVRVGDTVRRPVRRNTPAVHALLRHLEAIGFDGAPRVLGIDGNGREVLTWVDGEAGSPVGESDERLALEARLVRSYHDAIDGWRPPQGVRFHDHFGSGDSGPLVGHNDLGPVNTVFSGPRAVLIDWNAAGWASALWDVAYGAWRSVPLYDPDWQPERFVADAVDQGRRLRLYADAYGLDERRRTELLVEVQTRQRALAAWAKRHRQMDGSQWFRNAAYVEEHRVDWTARLLA